MNANDEYTSIFERVAEKIATRFKLIPEIRSGELYATGGNSLTVDYEQGAIRSARSKKSAGLGLRIIGEGGKEGMTYTTDFGDHTLDQIVELGTKMMKAATPNPYFKNLANPTEKYPEIAELFDPVIAQITVDQINDALYPVFQLKKKELAPASLSGGLSTQTGTLLIWNTNGVQCSEQSSSVNASVNLSLTDNGIIGSGYEGDAVARWSDLKMDVIAEESYEIARRSLKKATIETGKYPVLFSPSGVDQFFVDSLVAAMNAESIQNHLSFLASHRNTQIADPKFTLRDEPHLPGRISSAAFDDEGTMTRPLVMIDHGKFQEIYHNCLTAGREGVVSNGHASRGGYNAPVRISSHNVTIDPGNTAWQDMLAGIKKGVYFHNTGDSPNMITGDFSGLVMTGFLIEDGELGPALQETMVGINIITALKQLGGISKERKWRGNTNLPWIVVEDVSISSR
jgi:PmbA protein